MLIVCLAPSRCDDFEQEDAKQTANLTGLKQQCPCVRPILKRSLDVPPNQSVTNSKSPSLLDLGFHLFSLYRFTRCFRGVLFLCPTSDGGYDQPQRLIRSFVLWPVISAVALCILYSAAGANPERRGANSGRVLVQPHNRQGISFEAVSRLARSGAGLKTLRIN